MEVSDEFSLTQTSSDEMMITLEKDQINLFVSVAELTQYLKNHQNENLFHFFFLNSIFYSSVKSHLRFKPLRIVLNQSGNYMRIHLPPGYT